MSRECQSKCFNRIALGVSDQTLDEWFGVRA
jgi:hypothetical protein